MGLSIGTCNLNPEPIYVPESDVTNGKPLIKAGMDKMSPQKNRKISSLRTARALSVDFSERVLFTYIKDFRLAIYIFSTKPVVFAITDIRKYVS